jgi:hypothetical protein
MSKLVIEENVPHPKSVPEVLADLTPGQSVLIPGEEMSLESVRTTVWRIRKKHHWRRYTTGQEGTGVRVWRQDDKPDIEEPTE